MTILEYWNMEGYFVGILKIVAVVEYRHKIGVEKVPGPF